MATLRAGATRLDLFEGLAAPGEFGNDGVDGRSPKERLRVFVPRGQELVDRGNEFVDAEERITANAFVGEFSEPSLNQVQPAAAGWHIVDYKAAMFAQPTFDCGGAMSPIVVHDEV